MRADQAWVATRWTLERSPLAIGRRPPAPPIDGRPRFALLTVNCSTTRELKLMLLTLTRQTALSSVERIVIVDNASRDGAIRFLRELTARVDRIHLVERRWFPSHGPGMRCALRALEAIEQDVVEDERANLLLFCDPDVIWRRPDTLATLSNLVVETRAALAGEFRDWVHPTPDIQASFFVVRRDCYASPEVAPWVHHGSPAYWMQRSILRAGLPTAHFPSNHGGYVLHKGRAAVAATRRFTPRRPYATAEPFQAHFMGVPDGPRIWAEAEARFASLLEPTGEPALLARLGSSLARLGRPAQPG